MKKLIFIALAIFTFSSCVRDNFITETNYVEPFFFTRFVEIHRSDWRRGNDDVHGVHYWFEVRETTLTRRVFERGTMQAFLVYDRNGSERISPLPFSDFFVADNGVRWEEHITVEFEIGYITFIIKNDDQVFERPFFDTYEFMVRFLW